MPERKIEIRRFWWVVTAAMQWGISFFTDRKIFQLTQDKYMFYAVLKAAFLCLLLWIWKLIFKTAANLLKGHPGTKVRIFYGSIYTVILFLALLLTWPGIWRTDEFGILGNVVAVQIYWWQHFLTSLFYFFSFMIIPNPVGAIVIQVLICGCGFGYIAETVSRRTGKKAMGAIMLIPFCIPSVIMFQIYPMRITLYALLELVLLLYLYEHASDIVHTGYIGHVGDMNRADNMEAVGNWQIILLAVATAILATWRSEGIYYILLLPLWFLILFRKKRIGIRKLILYLFVSFGLFTAIYAMQSVGIHKDRNDAYEMTAYAQSLPVLLRSAAADGDTEGIAIAEKIVDVQAVMNAKEGIESFWAGDMTTKEYSPEEFKAFKKQFITWVFRYRNAFIKERIHTMLTSREQTKSTVNLHDSSNIQFVYFLMTFRHVDPINSDLRDQIITFMEQKVFCLFEIPAAIMAVVFVWCLLRKREAWMLIGMILIRIPLVLLTAPDNYFMYYYPFYLTGSVLFFFILAGFFAKDRQTETAETVTN
ncbi:MAG: hypothetical protein K5739_06355 [Lachnospiraceae bacterium]|nr:hypothetical protein [Lachnospiraceae bacterium]